MANQSPEDFFYTSPMSLDEKTFQDIRHQMVEMIKDALQKVRAADSTMLACLNLDWFRF